VRQTVQAPLIGNPRHLHRIRSVNLCAQDLGFKRPDTQ
jgi:hypothetical protein